MLTTYRSQISITIQVSLSSILNRGIAILCEASDPPNQTLKTDAGRAEFAETLRIFARSCAISLHADADMDDLKAVLEAIEQIDAALATRDADFVCYEVTQFKRDDVFDNIDMMLIAATCWESQELLNQANRLIAGLVIIDETFVLDPIGAVIIARLEKIADVAARQIKAKS